jgi:hypothetical protein
MDPVWLASHRVLFYHGLPSVLALTRHITPVTLEAVSRLGELLVRENLISLAQLQRAQEEQKKSGQRLGYSLTKLGIIHEDELTAFLSKQYGVPSINLAEFEISPDVIQLVPPELAKRHQLIPVNRAGATLIVAMSDPSNIYAIDDLKFRTGLNIEVVVARSRSTTTTCSATSTPTRSSSAATTTAT